MGQYYIVVFLANVKYEKEIIRAWFRPRRGIKLLSQSGLEDKFICSLEYLLSVHGPYYMSRLVYAGDYADVEDTCDQNSYHLASDSVEEGELSINPSGYRYILNHTQEVYIDKEKYGSGESGSRVFHPLSLLVSEGNGRGGGDYSGVNDKLCGTWARDIISVETSISNFEHFTEFTSIFPSH